MNAGTTFASAGLYDVSVSTTVGVNTDVIIPDLQCNGVNISGAAALILTDGFDWTAGNFSGSGTLTIPTGATLAIDVYDKVFDGWTLDNSDSATWSSASINGSGTFNNQSGGTLTASNSNGSLAYVQDTNGNRVTATYNPAGQLTLLIAFNGSALTIAYNAQGLISQVNDPAGRISTHTYNDAGQHLTAYTDKYGTTDYTYLTGSTDDDANALATIAYADNIHVFDSYDAQGRLTGGSGGGGAEALTSSYRPVGGYTVTDADHNATTILADDNGPNHPVHRPAR